MNWVHPISLLLVTWVTAFLQSGTWSARWGLGAQPDALPALVVYAAFNTGLPTTAGVAIVAGLSYDALSSGPFGLTLIPLTLLGVLLHRRRDLILRDSVWAQATLGLVATLAATVLSLTLLWIFGPLVASGSAGASSSAFADMRPGGWAGPEFGVRLIWQVFVIAVGGILATPLVFRFFGWIDRSFNYRPVVHHNNRADREIKRGRS